MPEHPHPKPREHPFRAGPEPVSAPVRPVQGPRYAELQVTSNFTFLNGASHPDELTAYAAALGHAATAIADTNTLAGVVRAHVAAKEAGIPLAVGCRLEFAEPAGLATLV